MTVTAIATIGDATLEASASVPLVYLDALAEFNNLMRILCPGPGQLARMDQTIHTAEIHEDTKLLDRAHNPFQTGADLKLRANLFSPLVSFFFK